MWQIEEHRRVEKQLDGAPREVLKRYEKWKDIAMISGPPGLRLIKGFQDEALRGGWRGYRSSRLGLQHRVMYRAIPEQSLFQVVHITPHAYRGAYDEDLSSGEKARRGIGGRVGSHHSRITGVQPE
jgi:mRNA-degrading endonuclease YafQ of YafQ-DinJ toxin-antitoxin module